MSDDLDISVQGDIGALEAYLDPERIENASMDAVTALQGAMVDEAQKNVPQGQEALRNSVRAIEPTTVGLDIVGIVTAGNEETAGSELEHELGAPGKRIKGSHYLERSMMDVAKTGMELILEPFDAALGGL